jgi:adenine-specific DNA-methyltransferase
MSYPEAKHAWLRDNKKCEMTFRYIGSKARLLRLLAPHIGPPKARSGRFVDLFCGTGAVAEVAAGLGWHVQLNDSLASAVTMAAARLTSRGQARFSQLGGYCAAIAHLNGIRGRRGALWREYSPASVQFCAVERRYFSEPNAAKLDAIRHQIEEWRSEGIINERENTLLVADLLSATNRCANIAGTYGCFLATWQAQALRPVKMVARKLKPVSVDVQTSCADAFEVDVNPEDVVYVDPPYTKRQYASYYHILETITLNDHPEVEGVCGLRPWKEKSSPFCFKAKALNSMTRLLDDLSAETVLISYSDEGHIQLPDLEYELRARGQVRVWPLVDLARYRPNKKASSNRASVTEYMIRFDRVVSRLKAVNE